MDSFVLYGPGGASPLQIGSWLVADPGADFGAAGLIRAQLVDSPFTEGALAFEDVGPRHMSFPLIVGSGGWGSLTQAETLLRQLARPGGYLDVQPEGVPSAEAVRFDVLSGRWEPSFKTQVNRAARRQGNLLLDTLPYGYWPTWITLASVASWGAATVGLSLGAVIGDAPGLLEVVVQATQPAASGFSSVDAVAWGLSRAPSFNPISMPSAAGDARVQATAMYQGGLAALTATTLKIEMPGNGTTFGLLAETEFPPAVEPAYRGRFRVFGQVEGSNVQFSLDAGVGHMDRRPLASAAPVATAGGSYLAVAGGMPILDLGEITLPVAASGASQTSGLRLWGKNEEGSAPVFLGGLYMLPVDRPAGIVSRGLMQRTEFGTATVGRMVAGGDYANGEVYAALMATSLTAQQNVLRPLRAYYRGPRPVITASDTAFQLLPLSRPSYAEIGATGIPDPGFPGTASPVNGRPSAAVSVRYRPRFQFLKGL